MVVEFLDGSLRLGAMVGTEPSVPAPVFSATGSAHPASSPADRAPKHFLMQFETDYMRVPSAEIRRLIVQPVERFLVRSDTSVATLHLGEGATRRPEPLNWFLPEARIEGWEWAVPQKTFYRWRYIPEACWIWSRHSSRPRQDASVLFRQEFRLPTTSTLVGAVLEISADDLIESLFINGVSIPIVKEPLLSRVERWDVTYLLQPGRNVIAARVTNVAGPEQLNYAGLCYRITGTLQSAGGSSRPAPPGVVLLFTNGDRLSGDLISMNSKQWRIRTAGTTLDIDSDWIELALMNYGETEPEAARAPSSRTAWLPEFLNLSRVLKGRTLRPAVTARVRSAFAWDLNILPVGNDRGVQARSGDWIEGRIETVLSNRVHVKPRYGETVGIVLDRIAYLQPNPPDFDKQFLFRPADFPAIVRIRLANNDVVTGALQSVSPFFVNLTPQVGRPARFDLDQVLSIDFAMNSMARHRDQIARAWPTHVPLQIGTIGEADSNLGPARDKTVRAIHRALINLGLEMRWLDAYEMVEPALLTPERFPILINLDQNERYFYTVKKPGDGLDAVVRYVQEGGTLLHLARGAPFSQGYIPESGRWKPVRPPRDLNAALQMDFVSPDRRSPRATSFQSPPNMGQRMTFILDRRSPWAAGLPDQVEIPMLADMRFRPITDDRATSAAKFIPIYRLVDSTGMNYGVAMAAVDYGDQPRPHYGIYISHLLYEADYEGAPMLDILLPKVIEMALGASPAVPIANMASTAPPASRDAAQAPPAPPAAIPR